MSSPEKASIEKPQIPSSFTREELSQKVSALRREAAEFEAMVREGRTDPGEPVSEIVSDKDNGNERIKRAIALHRKAPDFGAGLKKLAEAKETQLKLQAECEVIKERIGLCLRNPIFDGIEENDDRSEKEQRQLPNDNLASQINLNTWAQMLLDDNIVNDSDDEQVIAEYNDALEEVKKIDSELLEYFGGTQLK